MTLLQTSCMPLPPLVKLSPKNGPQISHPFLQYVSKFNVYILLLIPLPLLVVDKIFDTKIVPFEIYYEECPIKFFVAPTTVEL